MYMPCSPLINDHIKAYIPIFNERAIQKMSIDVRLSKNTYGIHDNMLNKDVRCLVIAWMYLVMTLLYTFTCDIL